MSQVTVKSTVVNPCIQFTVTGFFRAHQSRLARIGFAIIRLGGWIASGGRGCCFGTQFTVSDEEPSFIEAAFDGEEPGR